MPVEDVCCLMLTSNLKTHSNFTHSAVKPTSLDEKRVIQYLSPIAQQSAARLTVTNLRDSDTGWESDYDD